MLRGMLLVASLGMGCGPMPNPEFIIDYLREQAPPGAAAEDDSPQPPEADGSTVKAVTLQLPTVYGKDGDLPRVMLVHAEHGYLAQHLWLASVGAQVAFQSGSIPTGPWQTYSDKRTNSFELKLPDRILTIDRKRNTSFAVQYNSVGTYKYDVSSYYERHPTETLHQHRSESVQLVGMCRVGGKVGCLCGIGRQVEELLASILRLVDVLDAAVGQGAPVVGCVVARVVLQPKH